MVGAWGPHHQRTIKRRVIDIGDIMRRRKNMYRSGRIAERKVMNRLADLGYKNIRRSAGSRGPADIYAVKKRKKYYFQVKSGAG